MLRPTSTSYHFIASFGNNGETYPKTEGPKSSSLDVHLWQKKRACDVPGLPLGGFTDNDVLHGSLSVVVER